MGLRQDDEEILISSSSIKILLILVLYPGLPEDVEVTKLFY
jgi:hypothetical protein